MDGVRAKVSARLDHDLIRVTLEWVDVNDNVIGDKQFTEEFNLGVDRPGASYISRAVFQDGVALPGTFWLDEKNVRHFYLNAEAGRIELHGKEVGAATE